jgi:hypothetical protein
MQMKTRQLLIVVAVLPTGSDEPDEGIKEPNINSSPLECFSPIRTGKLTAHRFVINYI